MMDARTTAARITLGVMTRGTEALGMDADKITRIGDAERERAVTAIGEHYAAGRLDHDELDERIDAAWRARTQADIAVLFTDLPGASPVAPARAGRGVTAPGQLSQRGGDPSRRGRPPFKFFVLLAIIAVIALPGTPLLPLLLIPLFWIVVLRFFFVRVVGRRMSGNRTA